MAKKRESAMNLGGWIFLILSWGFILGLLIFCFAKVFSKKEMN